MSQDVLHVVHEKDPWILEEADAPEKSKWIVVEDVSTPPTTAAVVVVGGAATDKKGRRKSWHAIKFERKRRKGVAAVAEPENFDNDQPEVLPRREKRPSWWNIFAPQQWPRYT